MSGQNQAHELIARCFSETECGERKLDVLLYSEINAAAVGWSVRSISKRSAIERLTTVSVSRYIMRFTSGRSWGSISRMYVARLYSPCTGIASKRSAAAGMLTNSKCDEFKRLCALLRMVADEVWSA